MSRDRAKNEIPLDKMEQYDRLIAARPDIERKGAGLPYTSVNGHMFTFLTGSGALALRLPVEERKKFITTYRTTLVTAHGKVLDEYVAVPEALFKDTVELKKYLDISFDYVSSLKPKQARKKPRRPAKKTRD
jgi:hypothetical protein